MKKTSKLLAMLLACILVMSLLASCAGGGSPSTNTDTNTNTNTETNTDTGNDVGSGDGTDTNSGGAASNPDRVLNLGATQDSGTLYPLGVTGGFISVIYAFYEPLYHTLEDGSRRWVLATGLDRISDLQYTLTLRDDVTFSNGNPMTAEDVMFTMEQCKDNPQFSLNVKVVDFEKTKVTGDYTIDLWYTEFNASQEPGFASLLVMDKESFDEASLSRNPVGTGPYVVKDYVVNSHLAITARDDYWGGEVPIKNVTYHVINEEAQIINALETGDIDYSGTVSLKDASYVESLGYDVHVNPSRFSYVTMFSMRDGTPLASKEARWAVSHAIDSESIVEIVTYGLGEVPVYASSKFQYDFEDRFANTHDTYSIGYDPVLAEQYAEQSGLKNETLRIITNGSSIFNTIAEMVQSNLLDIGVTAEIVSYDQATYFGILMDDSNFEIAIFNPLAPSYLAVDILTMYLTFIPLGWSGPDRDLYGEISMGAIGTSDEKERGDKLFEQVKMFAEFAPWYAVCEAVAAVAISKDIGGYVGPSSLYFLTDLYFVN